MINAVKNYKLPRLFSKYYHDSGTQVVNGSLQLYCYVATMYIKKIINQGTTHPLRSPVIELAASKILFDFLETH